MARYMEAPRGLSGWAICAVLMGPFSVLLFGGSLEIALEGQFFLGFGGVVASAVVGYFLIATLLITMRYSALWDWHVRTGLYPGDEASGFGKGFLIGLLLTAAVGGIGLLLIAATDDQNNSYYFFLMVTALSGGGLVFSLFNGWVVQRYQATTIPNYDQYGPTNASHPMHPLHQKR